VLEGQLICGGCKREFDLKQGVPMLLPKDVPAIAVETAARFATEWTRWTELRDYYEKQFLDWVSPLSREDFAGKVVLEGGCGKGRHTALVAGFGAKAVLAVDLGESAWVAFTNTRHLENVHVVLGDVTCLPAVRSFDVAFSVGVLHHLPTPRAGFDSLVRHLKPGGKIAAWVYGQENNEWITRFVDPVRLRLTSRLPAALLKAASWVPSAGLYALIRTFYRPDARGSGPKLPYGDYFASMHRFPIDELHSIVFDQLVTPVAHYLPGDEVRAWFEKGFTDVVVRSHRGYSWTGTAKVADSAKK
jgi:SAM-dependent methyltransferase